MGKTRNILVVDDEPAILRIISQMLTKINNPQIEEITIMTAASGAEAIKYINESGTTIDLAFVDYVMPEISGLAVINALKQKHPEAEIVLMSGSKVKAEADNLGVVFMGKPFVAEDIAARLQKKS